MMNPASVMKLMAAKNKFDQNHPKFGAFLKAAFGGGIEEGTIMELTVKKPNGEELTTNIKVQQSDLELLEELKTLAQK
ncbi:MAG: hypothetical protein IJ409_08015 [Lachnospiraceae bacterium]|nr:hypothetical protein [Lachnospiraceae bacterium]